uniref:hypothetical protein n=1 Tax=Candidatus Cryptobacteroides bacterium TaxID=3085639 RepID=UPI004026D3AE
MNEIILTEKEYEFLQHFLVKNNFPIEILKAGVPPRLVLESDDMSLNMVDRLGDEVILHFDSEYEPTEIGRIIESLIDKING